MMLLDVLLFHTVIYVKIQCPNTRTSTSGLFSELNRVLEHDATRCIVVSYCICEYQCPNTRTSTSGLFIELNRVLEHGATRCIVGSYCICEFPVPKYKNIHFEGTDTI